MHPSIQTTYNDLAQALTGLKASAPKSVRVVTRQARHAACMVHVPRKTGGRTQGY